MSARATAPDRLARLLSIVPWVAAQDGPTIAEVCQRFGMTQPQLLADLDILFMVGLYPYTPDELIDVVVDEDRVWIRYADFFERPLRLTPEQALSLVAGSASLLAAEGADPDGPLARGLAKMGSALGISPEEAIDIHLGEAPPATIQIVNEAITGSRVIEIDYYTYGRDERSRRAVEPHRVYADQGHWYLAAFCRLVDDTRVFRLDRIEDVVMLEDTFEPPASPPDLAPYEPRPDDPRITIDIPLADNWVVQQYPHEKVEVLPTGMSRTTLAISALPWLERLLLRLGAEATVVAADEPLTDEIAADAARRILSRYQSTG